MQLRRAQIEDYDDVIAFFKQSNPFDQDEDQLEGLLRSQHETTKVSHCLPLDVSDVAPQTYVGVVHGRSVGMITVDRRVSLVELQQAFELGQYDELVKPATGAEEVCSH
jgi:hypothetical protein